MRDLIRVTGLEIIDEFGSTSAIAELVVLVAGQELRLRGLAIVRGDRRFRVSWPRYKHPRLVAKVPTWEPVGELRRAIQEVVLEQWRQRRETDRKISASLAHEPDGVQLFANERD